MHRLNRELPETEVRKSLNFFLFFPPLGFEELLIVCLEKEKSTPPRAPTTCGVLSRRKTKLRVGERYKIAVKSREEGRKEKSMARSRMLPSRPNHWRRFDIVDIGSVVQSMVN